MLISIAEARKEITWKHGFRDPHPTAAASTLKTKHRTKDLRANISQDAALSSGFLPRLAFYTKPLEFFGFEIVHPKFGS